MNKKILKDLRKRNTLNPIWKGPKQGVSQSILGKYFTCPERFYHQIFLGLKVEASFNPSAEYGQMWHTCEENHIAKTDWKSALDEYCSSLLSKYPTEVVQITHWKNVCELQFKIYLKHHKYSRDNKESIVQEEVFSFEYPLSNGRTFTLTGKWDAVDKFDLNHKSYILLQENKTKSQIIEEKIRRQLLFDLQTMLYLVAIKHSISNGDFPDLPIYGVLYNVIKRPLSGGKGTIRRHKATKNKPEESWESFYERLKDILEENQDDYFERWFVKISTKDILIFEEQTLEPILDNLYDDYEWWSYCFEKGQNRFNYKLRQKNFPKHMKRHYRVPYGIYHHQWEDVTHDLDHYLDTKELGILRQVSTLFPEL